MKLLSILLFLVISLFAQQPSAKHKEVITVLTRNAPTTFYYGTENLKRGFEYDLVEAFARDNNYEVKFIVKDSISSVLSALKNGEGDFIAAGLTDTKERRKEFLIGPGYLDVQEQVVCGAKKNPKSKEELVNYKIEIIAKSSYIETMKSIKKDIPSLKWQEHLGYTTEHIFERISKNKIECTISDSHIALLNRRYYPTMHVAFAVSDLEKLAWIFPKNNKSIHLHKKVTKWFNKFKKTEKFRNIKDIYFAHAELFEYYDVHIFHKRIKTLLPKYIKLFKEAGKKYKIDWRFIAAQSYQESHWNKNAKSPTGVRGMMMLTLPTAKQMGIKNRLDPRQSIEGGTKYMARQIKYAPKHVTGRIDRIKFALAGYNVGRGHIYDAIALGKKLGKNPYLWMNMKEILPLLSQRKYFKDLKYGYARGNEPVKYVTRINNYFEILTQYYNE